MAPLKHYHCPWDRGRTFQASSGNVDLVACIMGCFKKPSHLDLVLVLNAVDPLGSDIGLKGDGEAWWSL